MPIHQGCLTTFLYILFDADQILCEYISRKLRIIDCAYDIHHQTLAIFCGLTWDTQICRVAIILGGWRYIHYRANDLLNKMYTKPDVVSNKLP